MSKSDDWRDKFELSSFRPCLFAKRDRKGPSVWLADADGRLIPGQRSCEVVSSYDDATIVRVELVITE